MAKSVPTILFSGPRSRHRSSQSARQKKADPEVAVSQYFQDYVDRGKPIYAYTMQRLGKSLRAFIALMPAALLAH
jgi:hypothetical protein